MLKGLSSSYNRGLQEGKEPLFDSVDTVSAALEVFAAMLPELVVHRERMESAARDPQLLATDLAEYLVRKGVPFRDAHAIVGKLTASGKPLNALSDDEYRAASDAFGPDVHEILALRLSLRGGTATGASSPETSERKIARTH